MLPTSKYSSATTVAPSSLALILICPDAVRPQSSFRPRNASFLAALEFTRKSTAGLTFMIEDKVVRKLYVYSGLVTGSAAETKVMAGTLFFSAIGRTASVPLLFGGVNRRETCSAV